MSKWLKANGKPIMDSHGHPYDCPTCPCHAPVPTECSQAVDDAVTAYLAEIDPDTQQHVWALYGTYETSYQCAVWSYDDSDSDGIMEWRLVTPASGYLIIALYKGQIVTDTSNCQEEKLVYAKTVYKPSTGEVKTIGCECRVVDHECKHRKIERDGYMVAGTLRVMEYDMSDSDSDAHEYTPSDSCAVDQCELLKLKLQTAQQWHGGELMGEGYYDYKVYGDYNYTKFKQAIKWTEETSDSESTSNSTEPIYNLTYINCDCTSISTVVLQQGMTCLEYAGICDIDQPCMEMMLLHYRAVQEGMIWHGEGVIAHLAKITVNGTEYIGDWYALRDQYWDYYGDYGETGIAYGKRMACAETEDAYYIVGCGCLYSGQPLYKRKDHSLPASESNPDNYWHYFDLDGVCACDWSDGGTPDRELILTYPDAFGVYDVAFGNHAKFDYSKTYWTTGSPDDPSHEVTEEGTYIVGTIHEDVGGVGQRDLYIDYRCLCFTGKAFDKDGSVKMWVRGIYPKGSRGAPTSGRYPNITYHYWTRPKFKNPGDDAFIYDDISFTGSYYIPFTLDTDMKRQYAWDDADGTKFTGSAYIWYHADLYDRQFINNCRMPPSGDCYWDRDEAEETAGCKITVPTPCIGIGGQDGHSWQLDPILTPDFSVVDHPCQVTATQVWNPMDEEYETKYCIDAYRWITIGSNAGTYPKPPYGYGCAWYMYHVEYVYTNKGLIIKGLGGFQESYTLLGTNHYPQYVCQDYDEYEHPAGWDDTPLTATADNDMHWCCTGFEFDLPDESDSESDNSSSSN